MAHRSKLFCLKYILVILFNAGAWFNATTVVVEMPLLVFRLPESWHLPSLFLVTDTATLVVFASYVIWRHHHGSPDLEWWLVYCILAVGTVACLLEAFVWDITMTVNGKQTSLAFLILVGFICLAHNMSGVVFLPYMARVQKVYLLAYYTGEGLATLTPALLAMVQGVGKSHCVNTTMKEGSVPNSTQTTDVMIDEEPRFSVSTFLLIACGVTLLSIIAFSLLHFDAEVSCRQCHKEEGSKLLSPRTDFAPPSTADSQDNDAENTIPHRDVLTTSEFIVALVALLLSFGLVRGFGLGILPYATIPYSSLTYSLALCVTLAGNALGGFLLLFVYVTSRKLLMLLYSVATISVIYVIVLRVAEPRSAVERKLIWGPSCCKYLAHTAVILALRAYIFFFCTWLLISILLYV